MAVIKVKINTDIVAKVEATMTERFEDLIDGWIAEYIIETSWENDESVAHRAVTAVKIWSDIDYKTYLVSIKDDLYRDMIGVRIESIKNAVADLVVSGTGYDTVEEIIEFISVELAGFPTSFIFSMIAPIIRRKRCMVK